MKTVKTERPAVADAEPPATDATVSTAATDAAVDLEPAALPRRRRRRGRLLPGLSAVSTIVILAVLIVVWEAGSAGDWWSEAVLPRPGQTWTAFTTVVGTGEFWSDTGRSVAEVLLSFAGGSILGLLLGLLFWKVPLSGRIFEPYLVSFYAVPLVLFYPIMIVVIGINIWPIVVLSSVMAMIPMSLNTWVGLRGIRPVHLKLAASLRARPWQTLTEVAIPAAAPFIVAGLRLAGVYSLIGVIAMEFTTASAGLGFRIRYLYESFDNATMMAYIIVVLILSLLLSAVLAVVERQLLRGRSES